MKKVTIVLCSAFVVSACGAGKPSWLLNPASQGGFAGSGCGALAMGTMVARDIAITSARAQIANQVKVGVQNVARLQTSANASGSEQSYAAQTEQTANEILRNSRVTQTAELDIDNKPQLCVLVEVTAVAAEGALNSLPGVASATDKRALLRAFVGSNQ